jgi:hypothetical protein
MFLVLIGSHEHQTPTPETRSEAAASSIREFYADRIDVLMMSDENPAVLVPTPSSVAPYW